MRIESLLLLPALLATALAGAEFNIETTFKPEGCDEARKSVVGDHLSMHYTGSIDQSSATGEKGKVFDTSLKRGKPFDFTLGAGQVIKGWDEGLLNMCIGEKRTLTIPPEKGYGDRGAGGAIPGGATLQFTVELLSFDSKKGMQPPPNIFESMDTNKDGKISYDEMTAWFLENGPDKKAEIPRGLWEKEDKNGDHFVTWDEFSGPKGTSAPKTEL